MNSLKQSCIPLAKQILSHGKNGPHAMAAVTVRSYGITYSGGQASEGQGGFYGSGGARKTEPAPTQTWQRPQMLALAADVNKVTSLMEEVDRLEELYRAELDANGSDAPPSSKSIEIKAKIQKLCTNPEVMECLNRLEWNGEPVWGLSSEERDLITGFRSKVNEC